MSMFNSRRNDNYFGPDCCVFLHVKQCPYVVKTNRTWGSVLLLLCENLHTARRRLLLSMSRASSSTLAPLSGSLSINIQLPQKPRAHEPAIMQIHAHWYCFHNSSWSAHIQNNWSSLHNSRKKRTRILVCVFVYVRVSDSLSLCVFDPGTAYTNRAQLSAVFVMALCWLIIWPLTLQVLPPSPLCHRLTSSLLFIQPVTEQPATALNPHVPNVPQTLRHTVHINMLTNVWLTAHRW